MFAAAPDTVGRLLVFREEFQFCSRYTEWEQAELLIEKAYR
jgi:hypothetical protein